MRGSGFNYDFDDAQGKSRELRSKEPEILKTGDLLVTSGLDGLFPFGLPVAEVKEIAPLKEGDYSYAVIAKPLASDLNSLSFVYVLPPVGFDPEVASY